MRKKFKSQNERKNGVLSLFLNSIGDSIKKNKACFVVLLCVFLLSSFISLIDFATRKNTNKPIYTEYEVGQISDITVVARRNIIPATTDGLVIRAGEKIIKKGFPITEEAYEKLIISLIDSMKSLTTRKFLIPKKT